MLERDVSFSLSESIPSEKSMKSGLWRRSLAVAAVFTLGAPQFGALSGTAQAQSSPYFFYSGGKKNYLTASTKWAAVELNNNASASRVVEQAKAAGLIPDNAKVIREANKKVIMLPLDTTAGVTAGQAKMRLAGVNGVVKTLRTYGSGAQPIVETKEFMVNFKGGISANQAKALLAKYQAVPIRPLGAYAPNGYLVRLKDSSTLTSLGVANALYESGQATFSLPNFLWPAELRQVDPAPTPGATATPEPSPTAEVTPSPSPTDGATPNPSPTSAVTPMPTATSIPTNTVNDPLYPYQWHLNNTGQVFGTPGADVSAPKAWAITKGDPNITVAVIDSGVDIDHEDLKGKIVFPYDALNDDSDPSPDVANDSLGRAENHGTAVSGVAVGTGDNGIGITGVAPNCKLMPIRLIVDGNAVSFETVSRAFLWATTHGADIINNSWGFPTLRTLPDNVRSAFDYAVTSGRGGKGCVVLFASGNYSYLGESVDDDPLASYDKVIAVGASNSQDRLTYYSEGGKTLDVVAPSGEGSVNITTTDRTGNDGYKRASASNPPGYESGNYTDSFNGTSSACPLVAGIAALVLSQEPGLSSEAVRQRLINTADQIDIGGGNYDSTGFSEMYGYGRVNAYRALLSKPAIPTLLTPPDNGSVGSGNYIVSAQTDNDSIVSNVSFSYRGLYNQGVREVNKAIPDASLNESGILTDELTLPAPTGSGDTQAVVSVNIQHSYIGDLQVTLIAPDGTATILYDHSGGSQSSLVTTYTLPEASRALTGTYKLEVSDDAQEDTGTLVSWGIKFVTDWTDIGSTATRSDNGLYSVNWDTTKVPGGLYEVRALVNAGKFGTFTDINTNIRVAGGITPTVRSTVSGRVVDRDGKGVRNVKITLDPGGKSALTKSDGTYSIANVEAGVYLVTPSQLRGVFSPTARRIKVATSEVKGINFTLTGSDSIAPTVTVTQPAVKPNNVYVRLSGAIGTAVDTGGSGLAGVTGLLYRYASDKLAAGYWAGGTTYTTAYTAAKNEIAARVVTVEGRTTYSFIFPALTPGTYYFRATATDRAGNVGRSAPAPFVIDTQAPVVKVTQPVKNTANLATAFKQAVGTATDASGISKVTVLLSRVALGSVTAGYWNGQTWSATYTEKNNEVPATLSGSIWRFNLPELVPTRYNLRVTATDKVGNVGRSEIVVFTVKPPSTEDDKSNGASSGPSWTSLSSSAASSAEGIVRLNFSAALDAAVAAEADHYRVTVEGQPVTVEGVSYSASSNTVTLLLPPATINAKSTVVVSWSGLLDVQGRTLADDTRPIQVH